MRKEKRFIILSKEKNEIISYLKKEGSIDEYCLKNGYYYVETRYILIWKCNKERGKIRIKKYYNQNSSVYFLENKYKIDGKGYKKRVLLNENDALKLYSLTSESDIISSIKRIDEKLLHFEYYKDLKIKMLLFDILYQRIAYNLNSDNKEYRITVDYNLFLKSGPEKKELLNNEECILELKGEDPDIVLKLLNTLQNLIPFKFSKSKIAKKHLIATGEGSENKTTERK